MKDTRKQILVKIDEQIWAEFKNRCFVNGVKIGHEMNKIIGQYLNDTKKQD